MKIFPAIDIIDGKVVRLTAGDYDKVTRYEITPSEAAKSFASDGATNLHIVDLDGAKEGYAVNAEAIKNITNETSMFVEVGGGIRNLKQIEDYVSNGASRVILGTAAILNENLLIDAVKMFGDKIAVGVDEKDGLVQVKGWKQPTDIDAVEYCRKIAKMGVKNVVFTDISRDGMLSGINSEIFRLLCQIKHISFTAAGGITGIEDLAALRDAGAYAAIIGKALYEGKITLKKALEYEKDAG
ncbi:MAG: 1-(5-phosphoribosyl)-5-[(5-phosphoribosylamino)methylideneamino]imidazole-4-carboxamide isomerase [Clostridia bacterium]|nr:1-(5-phosphoribosyl)-5-[(5-phosphoribosylamino)methylideneamino]imidazole-4-carboxamide isomerase [Clostridia bacterium]